LISSSIVVNDNQWHHIVFTWTGDTSTDGAKIYIDGQLTASGTSEADDTGVRDGNDLIGKLDGAWGGDDLFFFHGIIDEVRIYNRALSPEEIRYHYNRGRPVAHWRFDEGSGSTIYDSSGNEYHGILHE